jgi:chromosome segregation ATPase
MSAEMGWDDDSSDSDSQQLEATPSSWATGAFEPFEVDEPQATEVNFLKAAYNKKERECEHLRQIIKELSQSRSKAHKTKVELEEQFAGLQKEYYRVLKVADLARTVSQQSVSRASNLKQELSTAQDQLRRSRRRTAAAEKQAKELRDENAALKQKLLLMEKIALSSDCRTSACAQEFLFSHSVSLY